MELEIFASIAAFVAIFSSFRWIYSEMSITNRRAHVRRLMEI